MRVEYYNNNDRGGDAIFGPFTDSIVPPIGAIIKIASGDMIPSQHLEPEGWKVLEVEYWLTEYGLDVSVTIEHIHNG